MDDNEFKSYTTETESALIMKGDEAWGIVYQDGQVTSYGWTTPDKGKLVDLRYCKSPEDATYEGDKLGRAQLRLGKLVPVKITKTVEAL